MEASEWSSKDMAFHGGTSLHLSWNSPRFSEDLDFLLDERAAQRMTAAMAKVHDAFRRSLVLVDPELTVQIKDRSTERMGNFQFVLSKPGVLGSVMVKAEFWRVAPSYLQRYQTSLRQPAIPMDLGGARIQMDAMLPAATLRSALADKLTAFATRPHLKWRDLFDYWWIRRQAAFETPAEAALADLFAHHVSAYQCTVPGDPAQSLLSFARRIDTEQTVAQAEQDLKPFLPQALWSRLWPQEVRLMVTEAAAGARDLAHEIQRQQQDAPQHHSPVSAAGDDDADAGADADVAAAPKDAGDKRPRQR